MSENPYQSPSGGAASRWFRPWRVLVAVIDFAKSYHLPCGKQRPPVFALLK
jgi:hypothetical protein